MKPKVALAGAMCVLAILILPVLTACINGRVLQQTVTGSGITETRTLDFAGFDRVEISGALLVYVSLADDFNVTITADDNVFEYIQVGKTGSTLYVKLEPDIISRSKHRIEISMPDLRSVTVNNASRVTVSRFNITGALDIEVSGTASYLQTNNIKAGYAHIAVMKLGNVTGIIEMSEGLIEASMGGSLDLDGSGNNVRLEAKLSSRLRLENFHVVNIDALIATYSSASVTLSGRLDAEVSGSSMLTYSGNPTLGRINVSMASKLSKR